MAKEVYTVNMATRKLWLIFLVGVVAFLFILSLYTVPAGNRGVLTTFGQVDPDVKGEGIGFKIPIAQQVRDIEVRTQKLEAAADSSSKDLQDIQTTIALNYHVQPINAAKLYQEIGLGYRERIIEPAIQEAVKAITARYTAEELITKRSTVRNEIRDFLSERLDKSYITVDDFNIVDFQFSAEFDKAIEQKVTAEQLKLKAERDLERIKIEKEQIITTAEAQAESLRIQKQEVTPELIELRQIEAQILAIEKWDGQLPQVTGSGAVPFINIE